VVADFFLDLWFFAGSVGLVVSLFALTSGGVRRAMFLSLIERSRGRLTPQYVVVGDSLGAQCPWGRGLATRPFGVLNLATGGATLREIGGQILRARSIRTRFLLVNGGLNDLLLDDAPLGRIESDIEALLRRVDPGLRVVVTLMPYVADAAVAGRIDEANAFFRRLAEQRGCLILDLNPQLSCGGRRLPEMTNDGLHFSALADQIWLDAMRRQIAEATQTGRI
jgi:lysophospholipase L1-like esterase